jgi:anaerobic selenocysteine-containing dehydrogenase
MTPTAEMADIVLPIASTFEREALKIGFEISAEAQSLVQLRPRIVPPRGEARSDTDFIFALAKRLGLGQHFWNGDVDTAYRQQLGPSGVTLEPCDRQYVCPTTQYGKHAVLPEGQVLFFHSFTQDRDRSEPGEIENLPAAFLGTEPGHKGNI